MALSKTEIARTLSGRGLGGATQIKRVLDGLADLAAEEIEDGEDFTVPGIAKVSWSYTKSQKKGERYKKGETYTGFGGQEITAEADSPARAAKVRLRAAPTGAVAKLKPSRDGQSAFLRSRTGKRIAARKG